MLLFNIADQALQDPSADTEMPLCRRYGAFYLTRNSLTYVAPVMLNDPALGLNLSQVGGLTSVLPLAYGMSKFVSGVLGSRTSPTVLLAGELMPLSSCCTHKCTEPNSWAAGTGMQTSDTDDRVLWIKPPMPHLPAKKSAQRQAVISLYMA